jgi:hypothetical protein
MSNKKPSTETFQNSLCRDIGHDWVVSTVSNYRTCQRHKCRSAQRLQDGVWINAVPGRPWTDPVAAYHKKHAMPQQSTLF